MADKLLAVRGGQPVGKRWAERFITRSDELKMAFNRAKDRQRISRRILRLFARSFARGFARSLSLLQILKPSTASMTTTYITLIRLVSR